MCIINNKKQVNVISNNRSNLECIKSKKCIHSKYYNWLFIGKYI